MLKTLTLIIAVLTLCACASKPTTEGYGAAPTQQIAATDSVETMPVEDVAAPDDMPIPDQVVLSSKSDMVCTREPVTGSRIGVKRCRTRAQIEAERQDTQEFLRSMRSKPQAPGRGG